jgi:ethanolamine permease
MPPYWASKYQLLTLCLLGSLSNIYVTWNVALQNGIGYELVFNVIAAAAFLFYGCCLSELSSTFPFPGGSYGVARMTVGFYLGYLVGCCEVLYFVLALGLYNAAFTEFLLVAYPMLEDYTVIILVLLFVTQVGLCVSKRVFWGTVTIFGICAFVINVAYMLGTIRYANFSRWAFSSLEYLDDVPMASLYLDDQDTIATAQMYSTYLFMGNDRVHIISLLPVCLWSFMGFEFVNLMCDEVIIPRRQVPFAQTFGMYLIIIFNICVPLLAASMAPGTDVISELLLPLVPSMVRVLGTSRQGAILLQCVGIFGYAVCATYALSKLLVAMSESRLFPSYLCRQRRESGVSIRALCVGSGLGACSVFIPALIDRRILLLWPNIVGSFSLFTYLVQLVGYIILRIKLTQFPRYYSSPFGIVGAVFAMVVFGTGLIVSLSLRSERVVTVIVGATFLITASLYYKIVAQRKQVFSAIEKVVMLPGHAELRNANGE